MNDLISRQAAIDALNQIFDRCEEIEAHLPEGDPDRTGYKMYPDYMTVWKYLHQLSSAQQWTPCSEGLPDEDFWSGRGRQFSDHVLVTIVNHANDDEPFADMAQTIDGIWQLSHDVDGDCSLPNWCEVIAWMPLPEPYKGEES